MYRNILFILALSVCSCPRILLDMFHSVSCSFKFASFFLFFPFPNWMFQEPVVWKVSGEIDRSIIIISIITVTFSISEYNCQKHCCSNWLQLSERFQCSVVTCMICFMAVLSQQSFLEHNGTQNHISICTWSLVAVGENTTSPCNIPLQSKAMTWKII
jgi:hypothetical protein